MKPDIQTTTDIQYIIDALYTGITADPVLGPYFESIEMEAHLPRLYAFWTSALFQKSTCCKRPLEQYATLEKFRPAHFQRWLRRFEHAVDTRYAGERAEHMKTQAHHIATILRIRLDVSLHSAEATLL